MLSEPLELILDRRAGSHIIPQIRTPPKSQCQARVLFQRATMLSRGGRMRCEAIRLLLKPHVRVKFCASGHAVTLGCFASFLHGVKHSLHSTWQPSEDGKEASRGYHVRSLVLGNLYCRGLALAQLRAPQGREGRAAAAQASLQQEGLYWGVLDGAFPQEA